jgi:SAM-dependent methyltransferase
VPPAGLYADKERIKDTVAQGLHREVVGGLWEAVGALQLAFLKAQGLRPEHRLLDIGCGCLRGGVHCVAYLAPGHYYGLDSNPALIEAGLTMELPALGLADRLPPGNLLVSDTFAFKDFGVRFDCALAHSLFTHLPEPAIRLCLLKLRPVLVPGGRFFATFFEVPDAHPRGTPFLHPHGVRSHDDADPYHYRLADFAALARETGWRLIDHGPFGHPRDQRMLHLA